MTPPGQVPDLSEMRFVAVVPTPYPPSELGVTVTSTLPGCICNAPQKMEAATRNLWSDCTILLKSHTSDSALAVMVVTKYRDPTHGFATQMRTFYRTAKAQQIAGPYSAGR